ncbi:MAG TPA: hypothetical protein VF742_11175, partial [Terracidiphilus sp.]
MLATKVDRSTVVQAVPKDGFLYVTHQWARAGLRSGAYRLMSEQEVQRLKLVAEIFGNAFERKRAEAEIG